MRSFSLLKIITTTAFIILMTMMITRRNVESNHHRHLHLFIETTRSTLASLSPPLPPHPILMTMVIPRRNVEREVEIMNVLKSQKLLQLYEAYDNGRSEMCLITE